MSHYGNQFRPPHINKNIIPGGWTPVSTDSPFVVSSIEFMLSYISEQFKITIPSDFVVHINNCAAQVVNGINVYLNITLDGIKVQCIVHHPITSLNSNLTINEIYIQK